MDLNAGWRFHQGTPPGAQQPTYDDSAWSTTDVPHTWNARDGQDGGGDYARGDGWYRRHIVVPDRMAGQRLFLQLDGANTVTDVWVNGRHLGQHRGGYARFRFDATEALNIGADNVIAVRVSNAHHPDVAPLTADYTFFGGLYRSVSLRAVHPVHVDMLDYAGPGVYVRQREVTPDSATVTVTTKLANNSVHAREVRVRSVIREADGSLVQNVMSQPVSLPAGGKSHVDNTVVVGSPRLWNAREDPYLYRVTVEVGDARSGTVLDVVTQPLGLRWYHIDAGTGFHLNGDKVWLRGVNRHQTAGTQGGRYPQPPPCRTSD